MSRISLEPSLNIMPLEVLNPLANLLGTEQERRNANQVMIGTKLKSLVTKFHKPINLRVIQTLKYRLRPITKNVLVISQQYIITVELNNLL